jgi:hypothetical protein
MPFKVVEHHADHIVEVIYPTSLTPLDHAEYTIQMKQIIERQTVDWGLLVDQRALRAKFDDRLKDKLLALNSYAQKRRMIRSARVVNSPLDAVWLADLIRDTELKGILRVFTDRNEAFAWLKSTLGA